MAYAQRWYRNFFFGFDDSSEYQVSILQDGFGGSANEMELFDNPVIQKARGQRDSIERVIQSTEVEINILALNGQEYFLLEEDGTSKIEIESGGDYIETEDAVSDQSGTIVDYDDILSSDYGDFIVKLISDPNGSPQTIWTGYIDPDESYRGFVDFKYRYIISARDGLNELSEITYDNSGNPYTGFDTLLSIIKKCISKIATISELQLGFRIQLNTYSNEMSSTECALEENSIPQEIFSNDQTDDCQTVIEKILIPFNCTLKQSEGYYWIVCNSEPDSYYHQYTWALGSHSRVASDLRVSVDNTKFVGSGQLNKIPPLLIDNITIYNKHYATTKITNGTFNSDTSGWTNGDADDSSNPFGSFTWEDLSYPLYGTLKTSVGSGAASYNFHSSSTFVVDDGAGANQLNIRLQAELTSESRSGGASAVPLIRIRLYNATDGYLSGSNGQQAFLTVAGYYNFEEVFTMTSRTNGAEYLDIEIEIQDGTTTTAEFHFDNITATQLSENEPTDWKLISFRNASIIDKKSETIYISDQFESDSDICGLKDAGGNYTESWDRFGKTDTVTLTEILAQQRLNEYAYFKDYVKCTIFDKTEMLAFHNFIIYNTKIYRILGYGKEITEGVFKCDMVEVPTSDVSISSFYNKLDTVYGEDQ